MALHYAAALLTTLTAILAPLSSALPAPPLRDDDDDTTCLLQTTSLTQQRLTLRPVILDVDATYFLQDPVAKIQVSSPDGSEPSKLLHTVEAIIDRSKASGGQISPEDAQMVQSVALMIEDISLPALEAGRLQNQRQVDRVGTSLATCEQMRMSADLESGGVEDRRTLLESSRAAHRSCRAEESKLEQEKEVSCTDFAQFAAGLVPPPGDFPSPAGPTGPMESFLRSNQQWFTEKYEAYMFHKERCEAATQLHAEKLQECNTRQTAFETSSCALSTSVHSMCAPYASCRDAVDGELVATWQDVQAIEEQRKVEYVTLRTIKCLIVSLALADETARAEDIAACAPDDLTIHYDGSTFDPGQLNITYPAVEQRHACSEDSLAPLLPCGPDFLAREYAVLPRNAPPAPCVPCAALPLGHDAGTIEPG